MLIRWLPPLRATLFSRRCCRLMPPPFDAAARYAAAADAAMLPLIISPLFAIFFSFRCLFIEVIFQPCHDAARFHCRADAA